MGGGLISRKDKTVEGEKADADAKIVFPFSYVVKSSGVMGGTYVLWADTDASRTEWRDKLQEAKTLSDVVADSNKVSFGRTKIFSSRSYVEAILSLTCIRLSFGWKTGLRARDRQSRHSLQIWIECSSAERVEIERFESVRWSSYVLRSFP